MCITMQRVEPIEENFKWKGKILEKGSWYGYWNGIPIVSDQYLRGNFVHIQKRNKNFEWKIIGCILKDLIFRLDLLNIYGQKDKYIWKV